MTSTLSSYLPSIAIEIHHEGPEAYNNMWQKSRSIWKYIGHHYKDEFDWFLIGGDDMYYIVSNLRKYLRYILQITVDILNILIVQHLLWKQENFKKECLLVEDFFHQIKLNLIVVVLVMF